MKFSFHYGSSVLTLPAKVIDLLATASEAELKVLLKLASCHSAEESEPAQLAAQLGMEEAAISGAIAFWRGAGILQTEATPNSVKDSSPTVAVKPAAEPNEATAKSHVQVNTRTGKDGRRVTVVQTDETPHYNAEDIERIFAENSDLSGLIDMCQSVLGKVFSPTEVNKFIVLTDYYRLDHDYIAQLCYHCKKIGKASVPYVDKMARSLWQEGIVTTEALEERIALLSDAADLSSSFRQLTGAGKRNFTEREMKFFTQWSKWKITPELLKLAYEVTVDNTGSVSMPYINKVLSNWQDAGYQTPEAVVAAMEAYKQKKEANAKGMEVGSFDTDEFFDAALARSLELHMKQTEQNN